MQAFAFDSVGLKKKIKHDSRRSSQKANKQLAIEIARGETYKIGSVHFVRVLSGIAPYNTRKGTEYLVPSGSICLAQKVEKWGNVWWMLYPNTAVLTKDAKGKTVSHPKYDSIEHVKQCVRGIRCAREEFKMSNIDVVWRDAAKVAFKAMLPKKADEITALVAKASAILGQ